MAARRRFWQISANKLQQNQFSQLKMSVIAYTVCIRVNKLLQILNMIPKKKKANSNYIYIIWCNYGSIKVTK